MHAMKQEMELFPPAALRRVMKNPAMHCVFDERPDQNSQERQANDEAGRETAPSHGEVEHQADDRKVDDQRDGGVDMGKELHDPALEHPDRLILIRDVTL